MSFYQKKPSYNNYYVIYAVAEGVSSQLGPSWRSVTVRARNRQEAEAVVRERYDHAAYDVEALSIERLSRILSDLENLKSGGKLSIDLEMEGIEYEPDGTKIFRD